MTVKGKFRGTHESILGDPASFGIAVLAMLLSVLRAEAGDPPEGDEDRVMPVTTRFEPVQFIVSEKDCPDPDPDSGAVCVRMQYAKSNTELVTRYNYVSVSLEGIYSIADGDLIVVWVSPTVQNTPGDFFAVLVKSDTVALNVSGRGVEDVGNQIKLISASPRRVTFDLGKDEEGVRWTAVYANGRFAKARTLAPSAPKGGKSGAAPPKAISPNGSPVPR